MKHHPDSGDSPRNLFRELRDEFRDRTLRPWQHPSFVSFFFVAVLGFSALGIWLELYVYIFPEPGADTPNGTDALRTAVLTFFPAVAGTAAMQLIWAGSSKHFRSAAFLLLALFLVAALVLFPSRIRNDAALVFGTLASICSIWIWCIANANQPELLDKIDPAAAVGGTDPAAPLSGSLDDYQH